MPISLSKGQNISLSKEAPGLSEVIVGLGWEERKTDGAPFDLDASAFILGEDGKVLNEKSFVFYKSKVSTCGAVVHNGDNLTGQGDGDDETLDVKLTGLPEEAKKIVFTVTIHDAEARNQNFGQVSNSHIRVINKADGIELARFDLSEDASTETAMTFGELYRHNGEWKFKAIGQGYAGGLLALATSYGLDVSN